MKSRWFWFGLAVFSVLVLATTFVCASTLFGDTPVTEALASASKDHVDESTSTFPSQAAPASDTTTPEQVDADASAGAAVVPAAQELADPPVPGQGGTCIEGSIIDRYHQARGGGWNVTITAPDGTPQRLGADSKGKFKFGDLSGGTWTVSLEVPGGWQSFTPDSFPVTLSGVKDDGCAEVRFKVEALACLEVIKLDANGQMGFKQKVGIPGWKMTLSQNGVVETLETDGEGKCKFKNLVPGSWWVVDEEAKTGWIPAPGYNSTQTINLVSPRTPGVCQSMTFVNKQIHDGCIQVKKIDQDGKPLKGWKVTLTRNDGTHKAIVKTTDTYGYATFDGLPLGEWTVHEEVKDLWGSMGPTQQTVDLVEPGHCKTVTFQNEELGCVAGYKINHLEQGLSNWEIMATNAVTGDWFITTTDEKGFFQFHKLSMGIWEISEVLQTGWDSMTSSVFKVEVTEPFKCVHVRFKNRTDFACLDVFKKDSADGVGLPGWEITVKPAYGGSPTTGTTDGIGHVRFNGLTPGTYIVSEKVKDEWAAVTAKEQKVTLEASGICKVVTFKNRQTTGPTTGGCPASYYTHIVRRGNTLYSIARKYGTTVIAIKQANGLYSNIIRVGQKLCVPDP